MNVEEKIMQLTNDERRRLGKIMLSTAKLLEGIVECQGPDDARIALCVAITSTFGFQEVHRMMPESRVTEITLDFAIDALIARRKR